MKRALQGIGRAAKRVLEIIGGVGDLITLLLLVLFVAVAPFVWIYRLAASGRVFPAGVVVGCWALSIATLVASIRFRWPTAIPFGLVCAWIVVLAFALGDLIKLVFI